MGNGGSANEIVAAGGVVVDAGGAARRVLLVHRPKYGDWSFPKGKAEPGETVDRAAIREVREETGLTCRIVRGLQSARYQYENRKGESRQKVVHYFLMEPEGGSLSVNNYEIDRAEWFGVDEAMRLLSYDFDKGLLDSLSAGGFK